MTVTIDPRIGTELLGYRIEALLGRGGMSVVYRAEDLRLKRKVALKLLAPELAEDERFRERFLRESELAASLDHPHIVPIYEAGEHAGQLYIAMRYVEGSDLKQLLKNEGALAPKRALAYLEELADALDAAHARGLVHRDVKPSNALLDNAGHLYLSDFGLTKSASDRSALTMTGRIIGTVDYAAPEQIEGKGVDGRADVYSLGCLLYECLAGEVPFPRDSELAVLWAHVHEKPPTLPAHPALDPVIAKALAKDPADRYASCHELVEATRAALGLREVVVVRDRKPLLLTAAGAAVVVAAVLAGVLLTQGGGKARPSTKPTLAPKLDSLQRIDPRTNKLAATIAVASNPTGVTVGAGSVWVGSVDDQVLLRIDPRTNAVTGKVTTGGPEAIAFGTGSVWTANGDARDSTLSQIDPATLAVSSSPNTGYRWVAVGEGAVWTLGLNGLVRVNRGGNIVRTIPSANGFVVRAGYGGIWVLDDVGRSVTRTDPATNRVVRSISLGFDPGGLALGAGGVWVTSNSGDAVAEIDPATNRIRRSIRVGDGPIGVAVGEGSVWVANYRDGTVSRIDPARGLVVATIRVGRDPTSIAAGAGGVWVTVRAP